MALVHLPLAFPAAQLVSQLAPRAIAGRGAGARKASQPPPGGSTSPKVGIPTLYSLPSCFSDSCDATGVSCRLSRSGCLFTYLLTYSLPSLATRSLPLAGRDRETESSLLWAEPEDFYGSFVFLPRCAIRRAEAQADNRSSFRPCVYKTSPALPAWLARPTNY